MGERLAVAFAAALLTVVVVLAAGPARSQTTPPSTEPPTTGPGRTFTVPTVEPPSTEPPTTGVATTNARATTTAPRVPTSSRPSTTAETRPTTTTTIFVLPGFITGETTTSTTEVPKPSRSGGPGSMRGVIPFFWVGIAGVLLTLVASAMWQRPEVERWRAKPDTGPKAELGAATRKWSG
jgi:hypothetical protein